MGGGARDSATNGDGKPDMRVYYKDGEKLIQEEDLDFDGQVDVRYPFKVES